MNEDRFKFRVWNPETGHYEDSAAITIEGSVWTPQKIISNPVIEQCTGLKDKNGNLIYEGDIIRDVTTQVLLVIRWNEERSGFVYLFCGDQPLWNDITNACEIIGNIHTPSVSSVKSVSSVRSVNPPTEVPQ